LKFLLNVLGLKKEPPSHTRYQLLHRAASAIITGEQYRSAAALLIVHSFSPERNGWPDYCEFTRLFGVQAEVGSVQSLTEASTVPLFGPWADGNCEFQRN